MTVVNKHPTHKDVTYIGREDPFLDRNYGSNLEFVPGQSRTVPVILANRFLQHVDCFEETKPAAVEEAPPAKPAKQAKVKEDDTDAKLKEQKDKEDALREKQNKVFEQHQLIDTMNKADLMDYLKTHFKETPPSTTLKADLQAQAKSLVDQFGIA